MVSKIFANFCDPWVVNRLCLDAKPNPESAQSEQEVDAKLFVTLCVNMASQRSWSMSPQWMCQPDNWLGLLNDDVDIAQECLKRIQSDCELIGRAWELLQEQDASCDLQDWDISFLKDTRQDNYCL